MIEKLRSELLPPAKNNSGKGICVASTGMDVGGQIVQVNKIVGAVRLFNTDLRAAGEHPVLLEAVIGGVIE